MRLEEQFPFRQHFMEQIWDIVIKVKGFEFYELETPRKDLVISEIHEVSYFFIVIFRFGFNSNLFPGM